MSTNVSSFVSGWFSPQQTGESKNLAHHRPMNVILGLEGACNLHCIQCDIWKTRVAVPLLPLEKRKQFIDRLKAWLGEYTLTFFAGEPLLHPHTFPLISYASSQKVKTLITTNGTMLHAMKEKIFSSQLTTMIVSIDSYKAKTHDEIRGVVGTHDRVISNLREIIALRGKTRKPKIILESLIMSKNYKDLPKFVEWAVDIGVDGVLFQPVTSKYGFGSAHYNPHWHNSAESLLPASEAVSPILSRLVTMKKQGYPIRNTYAHLSRACAYFLDPDEFVTNTSCLAHKNFSITENGTIMLCFSQAPVGNASTANYSEVWHGPEAHRVRKSNKLCPKTSKILLCNSLNLARATEKRAPGSVHYLTA